MPLIPANKQTLDVIIATYNRCALLSKTLKSLLAAKRPEGLSISVTVVDNNSTDNTPTVVEEIANGGTPFPIRYLFEPKPGKSYALNAGLRSTSGSLVGMIDDDEEIDSTWFQVILDRFKRKNIDFIGGPCHPNWTVAKPDWVTFDVGAAVGWVNWGCDEKPFERNGGILLGGNAVIRRSVFQIVGEYDVNLGRTAKGLLSYEDSDMYYRILAAGFHGLYVPSLIIHHFVAPERLQKNYHRRWHWGNGISTGVLARREAAVTVEILGIPRWKLACCGKALVHRLAGLVGLAEKTASFHAELKVWNLFGFIYGRHFCKTESTDGVTIAAQELPLVHAQVEEAKLWLRA